MRLIRYFDENNSRDDLIAAVRSMVLKSSPQAKPRIAYYVASSLKLLERIDKYKLDHPNFELVRAAEPQDADYILLDLDNPPPNWINFIGGPVPRRDNIILVEMGGQPANEEVRLNGGQIFNLIQKSYNITFELCRSIEEIHKTLTKIEYDKKFKNKETLTDLSSQMAISMIKQTGEYHA